MLKLLAYKYSKSLTIFGEVGVLDKREYEKEIINLMIEIYCKGNKHSPKTTCQDCTDLITYCKNRIDKCPVMETKTFCKNCSIHCYSPENQEKIKRVMRYSGPRMIFYHPKLTIRHIFTDIRAKIEKNNLLQGKFLGILFNRRD